MSSAVGATRRRRLLVTLGAPLALTACTTLGTRDGATSANTMTPNTTGEPPPRPDRLIERKVPGCTVVDPNFFDPALRFTLSAEARREPDGSLSISLDVDNPHPREVEIGYRAVNGTTGKPLDFEAHRRNPRDGRPSTAERQVHYDFLLPPASMQGSSSAILTVFPMTSITTRSVGSATIGFIAQAGPAMHLAFDKSGQVIPVPESFSDTFMQPSDLKFEIYGCQPNRDGSITVTGRAHVAREAGATTEIMAPDFTEFGIQQVPATPEFELKIPNQCGTYLQAVASTADNHGWTDRRLMLSAKDCSNDGSGLPSPSPTSGGGIAI